MTSLPPIGVPGRPRGGGLDLLDSADPDTIRAVTENCRTLECEQLVREGAVAGCGSNPPYELALFR